MDEHFPDLLEMFLRPVANRDRSVTNRDRPAANRDCVQHGGLDLWQDGLDLQKVRKIFPGGRKNVCPFSCIKFSKFARFGFDITLPQYGYPTHVNRWSRFKY